MSALTEIKFSVEWSSRPQQPRGRKPFDSSQGADHSDLPVSGKIQERQAMTASTMLVVIMGVFAFAAFATIMAWAQLYARPTSAAPVQIVRPKRRSF